jgi:hypothetical protein
MQPTTTRFFLKQLSLLVLIKKITRINHYLKTILLLPFIVKKKEGDELLYTRDLSVQKQKYRYMA